MRMSNKYIYYVILLAAQIPQKNGNRNGNGNGGSHGGGSVSNHETLSSHNQNKRRDEPQIPDHMPQPKKPRLVFTDLQRRTLQAIFKVRI